MEEKVSNWEDTYDERTDRTVLDDLWDEDVTKNPVRKGKLHYTLSSKYLPKSWRLSEKLTGVEQRVPPHVYYEDIPGTIYCYRDVIKGITTDYSGDNLLVFYSLPEEFYEEYNNPFYSGENSVSKNYPYPNDIVEQLVMRWIEDWKTKSGIVDGQDFLKDIWHSDIFYNFTKVWGNEQLRYTLCNLLCGLGDIPFQKVYDYITYQLASQSQVTALNAIFKNVDDLIKSQADPEVLWTCAEMFTKFINSDLFREALGERKSWQTVDPDDYDDDDDDFPGWIYEEKEEE